MGYKVYESHGEIVREIHWRGLTITWFPDGSGPWAFGEYQGRPTISDISRALYIWQVNCLEIDGDIYLDKMFGTTP